MENEKQLPRTGKKISTQAIVGIGLLTAIVVVLQFVSMGLRFSAFSITLTLVPIVVGAALYGWQVGAWLGFVFGVAVLLTGDANAFLVVNAPGTIITVLAKGALSGLCSGLVYRLVAVKNQIAAVFAAAVTAPVVNTGVFLIGCVLFFLDTIKEGAGGANLVSFILIGFVGINFLIELGINIVLNPAIVTLIKLGKKTIGKN